jgi:hypothetical protein
MVLVVCLTIQQKGILTASKGLSYWPTAMGVCRRVCCCSVPCAKQRRRGIKRFVAAHWHDCTAQLPGMTAVGIKHTDRPGGTDGTDGTIRTDVIDGSDGTDGTDGADTANGTDRHDGTDGTDGTGDATKYVWQQLARYIHGPWLLTGERSMSYLLGFANTHIHVIC